MKKVTEVCGDAIAGEQRICHDLATIKSSL